MSNLGDEADPSLIPRPSRDLQAADSLGERRRNKMDPEHTEGVVAGGLRAELHMGPTELIFRDQADLKSAGSINQAFKEL